MRLDRVRNLKPARTGTIRSIMLRCTTSFSALAAQVREYLPLPARMRLACWAARARASRFHLFGAVGWIRSMMLRCTTSFSALAAQVREYLPLPARMRLACWAARARASRFHLLGCCVDPLHDAA